jgi:lantibiotic modifying enzyme
MIGFHRRWLHGRQIVDRARRNGGFRTMKEAPAALSHPGFFQGLAGIGYTLLRVLDPYSLPSILLWRARSCSQS